MKEQWAICYDHPESGRMWYGRGRYATTRRSHAIPFDSVREAEDRLLEIRRLFACGPDLDQRLIQNVKIVKLEV